MNAKPKPDLVFALHPTTRGFGWVLFDGPSSPIDWGTASARQGRNAKLIRRLERILSRHDASFLILETYDGKDRVRSMRIQSLCKEIHHLAVCKGLKVRTYSRATVQRTFAQAGAATRHEIALAIAERIDALSHRLPPRRMPWREQDPRQSLFDAAALVLTYFANNGG